MNLDQMLQARKERIAREIHSPVLRRRRECLKHIEALQEQVEPQNDHDYYEKMFKEIGGAA